MLDVSSGQKRAVAVDGQLGVILVGHLWRKKILLHEKNVNIQVFELNQDESCSTEPQRGLQTGGTVVAVSL